MCGISGYVGINVALPDYVAAHKRLGHRGADDEGFVGLLANGQLQQFRTDKSHPSLTFPHVQSAGLPPLRAMLGHHRLSIHDLNVSGHQPMANPAKSRWLVHNGEIYNFRALRESLRSEYQFVSDSDSEVIVAAFEKWGHDCWARFNGMWSVAILDTKRDKLVLSRDRFGVKPLYYSIVDGQVYFASESKFFAEVHSLSLNQSAAKDYLGGLLIDHRSQTLYSEVFQVEPGEIVEIDLTSKAVSRFNFWRLEDTLAAPYLTEEEALFGFNALFDDAVGLRLDSDVPVGALLSGGLDSTSIVCNLAYNFSSRIDGFKTFSVIHEDDAVSEERYIRDTLEKYQQLSPNFVQSDEDRLLASLRDVVYMHDFPIRGFNVFTWYELYQWIAENTDVKVTFSGQGADEMFGGYKEHFNYHLLDLCLNGTEEALHREIDAIERFGEYTADTQRAIIAAGKRRFPTRRQDQIRPFFFNVEHEVTYPAFDDANPLRDILARNLRFSALREFLRYEDRNSMAATIESRAPFMDYRLVEFAFRVPNHLKIKDGMRKVLVRNATSAYNGQAVLGRTDKQGFDCPQSQWQRGRLRNFMDERIFALKLDFIDVKSLQDAYHDYVAGERDDWRLWGTLALFQEWSDVNGV